MTDRTNRRLVLSSRPEGPPKRSDFRLETVPVLDPLDGEIVMRNRWLSIDPYVRGMLSGALPVGTLVEAAVVAEIVESSVPDHAVGQLVVGLDGWQDYATVMAGSVRPIPDVIKGRPSDALGVLGATGFTAYIGLIEFGRPRAGDTMVVAAAAGAVGSIAGQIAKIRGARAVGIAGGEEKCRALIEEFGFDAAVDRRSPTFLEDLQAACPDGIDIYFENVGGLVTLATLPLLNPGARIPLCGFVAHYNDRIPNVGTDNLPVYLGAILRKRAVVTGFMIDDWEHLRPQFERDMSIWLGDGRVRHRIDVTEGLENAPEALARVLDGRSFGKAVVQLP
jgi:NADPH-dependent curcumin reductase CurA